MAPATTETPYPLLHWLKHVLPAYCVGLYSLVSLAWADVPGANISIANDRHIILVADPWCPYNCEPDSARPGVLIEMLSEILNQHDYSFEYRTMDWRSAKAGAAAGEYHAILGAYKTDAITFVFPECPMAVSQNILITRLNDDWLYQGRKSLEGRHIGVVAGYNFGQRMDQHLLEAKRRGQLTEIGGVDALPQLIKKLQAKELDTVLDDKKVIQNTAHELGLQVREAGSLPWANVYVAFSPAHPEQSKQLAQWITVGVTQMTRSERFKALLKKYQVDNQTVCQP